MASYVAEIGGNYRIANDALTGFLLYQGLAGAEPDFDSAAFETFTAFPHTTAALPANDTYKFVVRKRNKYGLETQNIETTEFEIDALGAQAFVKPSAPVEVTASPGPAGVVDVTAKYYYLPDEANAATQWLVYVTNTGVDPDPGVDSPTVTTINKTDGVGKFIHTTGAFADAADIRVLVRVRRIESGPTNVDSSNLTATTAVADTDGPAVPVASCEWAIVTAHENFTTLFSQDSTTFIEVQADLGIMRFWISGVLVAAIGSSRRLYLKGKLTLLEYSSDVSMSAVVEWNGAGTLWRFGVGSPLVRVMELDANGDLRVQAVRSESTYPKTDESFTDHIEYHATPVATEFSLDLVKTAMSLEETVDVGIHNGKLHVRGIRSNAL